MLRPYQIEANTAIEKAIAERKRQMLVAMATGTGKTFTMVNQIYRLMESGVAKRILFLVDRRALAAQAVGVRLLRGRAGLKFDKIYEVYSQRFQRDDFDEDEKFDPRSCPQSYLTDPKPGHAFVYVSTIQRMAINLFGRSAVFGLATRTIDDDAEQLDIPIHAFDLIIADECHRGYTAAELSIWRDTLDHFDAIKIGLTATPAAHTTAYFKDVVYRYEYERAVREGYLVDYDVVTIKSDVRMNGDLPQGGRAGRRDRSRERATQARLARRRAPVRTAEIERKVTSPDSNRKILEEIKKYALEHEQRYGRFPKTLIFAANDLPHTSHADQLVDLARDVFGRGDSFVQKITGQGGPAAAAHPRVPQPARARHRGHGGYALDRRGHPRPGVHRLPAPGEVAHPLRADARPRHAQGRAVPGQVALLRLRLLRRHAARIFPERDRHHRRAAGEAEPRPIAEIIEDIWANRDRDYNIRCLVKRLQRIDKEMSGEARELFAALRPRRRPEAIRARAARQAPRGLHRDDEAAARRRTSRNCS